MNHKEMRKVTQWQKREKSFTVEVVHHVVDFNDEEGKNRWNVYAYLNDKHPRFSKIGVGGIFQVALDGLPFHWGCTYCEKLKYGETFEVWKIGSDYAHIDDRRFKEMDDPEDAWRVFADAEELFAVLLKEQNESVVIPAVEAAEAKEASNGN